MPFSSTTNVLDRRARGLGRTVGVGEGLDQAVRALVPGRRHGDAVDPRHPPDPGRDHPRVAVVLDEHDERLHHARRDVRVREHLPAVDRVALAGEVLGLRLARVELHAVEDEHRDDREADRRHRPGMAHDEPRPATPGAVLRVAAVDEALRQQADAVDPRAEGRQQRRQQRDRRDHRDRRDQQAADPDRADERQRQHEHREQARRPRSSPRRSPSGPACVIVSTSAVSTSSPSRSSSRKRKIISSA